MIDWNALTGLLKETGISVCLGTTGEFTRRELRDMAKEADQRRLCISMGNPDRNPDERKDELYVTAKL